MYIRAVPQIIFGEVGRRHFFVLWGEGVLVEGVEGGNLSWGSRSIWSIVGQGLIEALTCPEGRGALTPCVSWGWRGLKKNAAHPPKDNFWNSPYLLLETIQSAHNMQSAHEVRVWSVNVQKKRGWNLKTQLSTVCMHFNMHSDGVNKMDSK